MKDLKKNISSVLKRLKGADNCVLMLDFDGTLSPIADSPDKAFLSKETKKILEKLIEILPIVIISGRRLKDLKVKVGIKGLIYAGNQGLEWQIKNKVSKFPINERIKKEIKSAKKIFKKMSLKYKGVFVEDKDLTFSVHYRLLDKKMINGFLKEAGTAVRKIKKAGLVYFLEGKKVLEARPQVRWNKGYFSDFILSYFKKNKKNILPIYIGDDTTDEDVFKIINNGITIRVGYRKGSRAGYFLKDQKKVAEFLSTLLFLSYNKKQ